MTTLTVISTSLAGDTTNVGPERSLPGATEDCISYWFWVQKSKVAFASVLSHTELQWVV